MDRILIAGLRELGVHGVLPEEQERAAAVRGRPRAPRRPRAGRVERRARRHRRLRRGLRRGEPRGDRGRALPAARAARDAHRRGVPVRRARAPASSSRCASSTRRSRARSTTSASASSAGRDRARVPRARLEPRRPARASPARGRRARRGRRASQVVAVSPVYETAPVGGPPQDAYLNAVVAIDTDLDPHELLRRGQAHRGARRACARRALGAAHARRRRAARGRRRAWTTPISPFRTRACGSADSCSRRCATSRPTWSTPATTWEGVREAGVTLELPPAV